MEVNSIVKKLLPLEDGTTNFNHEELQSYIDDICSRVEILCDRLAEEIV
jgi:hypothetical protein